MSKVNPSIKSAVLEERYPELSFLLRIGSEKPFMICEDDRNGRRDEFLLHRSGGIEEEVHDALAPVDLEKIEVLYIYGIGLGHYGIELFDWLEKNVERDLVFIEDDMEVLRLFFQSEHTERILSHPQIHIRTMLDPDNWEPFLEECARDFPYEHVEMISLESYSTKNDERLYLMRRSVVHHAIHIEEKFHHLFFKNVYPNFRRLSTAFSANQLKDQFRGVPAIICGAGPSLEDEMETLRLLGQRGLVFAGGSAIAGLSHAGIIPHLGVAIDPNFEEYERFKFSSAFEIPLLHTNRLHPRVFETFNGPHGYVSANTGGPIESWWEKELGMDVHPLKGGFDIEALSVTTACIELAATFGCNPIILAGVDLAFTNEASYAAGIVNQSAVSLDEKEKDKRACERLLKRKDRLGRPVHTLVKWVMESGAIANYAKANPEIEFINATSGGIGFEGIPYLPLNEISFPPPSDISGRIHQLIEANKLPLNKELHEKTVAKLKKSLQEAKILANLALEELERVKQEERDPETGRMIFYQMELEELDAYLCCLKMASYSFQKTFARYHRYPVWKSMDDQMKWKFLHSKWLTFKDLISFYLKEF